MPNDGYTLYAVKNELNRALAGARINKVLQPEADEVVLVLHNAGTNYRLALCCSPVFPRIHLTQKVKENPLAAPAFCMTLRKHLTGATVNAFLQNDLERVVRMECTVTNELFDAERKSLILEIMGKHSNLILADGEDRILAANKNVSFDVSSVRQIMPGLTYRLAETQHKAALTDREAVRLKLAAFPGGDVGKYLAGAVTGLSNQTGTEICYRAIGTASAEALSEKDAATIIDMADKFYNAATNLDISPLVTLNPEGKPLDFFLFPYQTQGGNALRYPTINEAIDSCCDLKDRHQRFAERSKHLSQALKGALSRAEKKLSASLSLIEESRDYETQRLYGELVTANLYRIRPKDKTLTAQNYYSEDCGEVQIALDPQLTPAENAQRYYKKYTKKKRAFSMTTEQTLKLREHVDYLQTILESFEKCTESSELNEIKRELEECGILKETAAASKKQKAVPSQPLKLILEGYTILVGKNNFQNDALTKSARPEDLWLHASKIHGSHVVVENPTGKEVPHAVIERAAQLAAYYSQAKNSPKVPVDYTRKKFVKKPSKSVPGFVIYTDQKTIMAEPKD